MFHSPTSKNPAQRIEAFEGLLKTLLSLELRCSNHHRNYTDTEDLCLSKVTAKGGPI
jgi:hypothetical protein